MIVLARVVKAYEQSTTEFEQRDGNWYPKLVEKPEARACMYANRERPGGYQVFLFDSSERRPLETARAIMLEHFVDRIRSGD
jgi:hypothetical protein